MSEMEGADELVGDTTNQEPLPGTSPQDTGGGGGNQTRKMNIGGTWDESLKKGTIVFDFTSQAT